MLGKRVAAVIVVTVMGVSVMLAATPAAAQVTPNPILTTNATSGGRLNINVQLPTVPSPTITTPTVPSISSPSPTSNVTIVEQMSGPGGLSPWLSLFSSWLWLFLITIIILLVIAIVVLLVTRRPRYEEYEPEDGYYEETHRVTRRRRRY
ncbi:MAG: hypothetical protein ACXVIG_04475 [Halobacteriota archaeon]